jgi:hypothetical protein
MLLFFVPEAANTSASLLPKDFFTITTFGTLAGSTGAVYVLCGTAQSLSIKVDPKWLAFITSILISYIAAFISNTEGNAIAKYAIAFLNGCLIYLTAAGSNTLLAPRKDQPAVAGAPEFEIQGRKRFNSSWF